MNLFGLYKHNKSHRHALCAWFCFVGLLSIILAFFSIPGSRVATNLFQGFIVFPVCILAPESIGSLWKKSFLFRGVVLLFFFNFATLFWGEQVADIELSVKFLRRILYTTTFISGITLSQPLFHKYPKVILTVLFICSLGAGYSLIQFFSDPSIHRLTFHFEGGHPNQAGWIYGLVGVGIIAAFRKNLSEKRTMLIFATLTLLFFTVLMTASRSSILGILSTLCVFIFFVRDRRAWIPCTAMLIAILLYIPSSQHFKNTPGKSRYSAQRLISRKDAGRLSIWGYLIDRMDAKDKVIGKGFLADDTSKDHRAAILSHSHSLYVSSFYHGGIIALLLHIGILTGAIVIGFRETKNGRISIILLLAFMFIPSLTDGKGIMNLSTKFPPEILLFWIPISLAVAAESSEKDLIP